jgi:two-component system NtrC family sensor kinase
LAIENARLVQTHMQQERLAAAGETVAYLSHYIKNILQGTRSGADIVQRGLDHRDLSLTAQGWRIVERNLDRTYNLMLNMLAWSKQREPRFETLQVNKIVEDVVALVQRLADDAKVVLLADLDDSLPPIPVDYDGIQQVILNLINNAIDAVERSKGIINVRTAFDVERRQVLISVTDNGPGVPPELRTKIFEPFYSTKGHGGTGLGLAVARKIVEELDGTLELVTPSPTSGAASAIGTSSPTHPGAEFRVRLPTSRAKSPSAADTLGPTG